VIDSCKETTIEINLSLITALIEIISSEKLKFIKEFNNEEKYQTIQVDKSKEMNLQFTTKDSKLPNIKIITDIQSIDNTITFPDLKNEELKTCEIIMKKQSNITQYQTIIQEQSIINTTPIIRENGYATTIEEVKQIYKK
jgi:hypothetical protein